MGERDSIEWEHWMPESQDLVRASVDRLLCQSTHDVCGIVGEDRVELHHSSARRSLRAPQLVVDIQVEQDGGTRLKGRFGPHPHVWAASVGAAAMCAFAALFSLSYAYAQWVMGQAPTALFGLAASTALGAGALCVLRLRGRHETPQAKELRDFLHRGLPSAAPDAPPRSHVRHRIPEDEATQAESA